MNVTVLGAGSWGTTVASLTTALNPTDPVGPQPGGGRRDQRCHTNATYLPASPSPGGCGRPPTSRRPSGTPTC